MKLTSAAVRATLCATWAVAALVACRAARPPAADHPDPARRACPSSGATAEGLDVPVVADSALGEAFQPSANPRTPRYPEEAWKAGASGMVVIDFEIDTGGRVDPCSVRIVESSTLLPATADRASGQLSERFEYAFQRAVRHWLAEARWPPPRLDGRPVRARVHCASFSFSVNGLEPRPPARCTPRVTR
jgi:TonB family protein